MIPPQPSEAHGVVLPPDEHLACVDYLYYVCAHTVSYVAPFDHTFLTRTATVIRVRTRLKPSVAICSQEFPLGNPASSHW